MIELERIPERLAPAPESSRSGPGLPRAAVLPGDARTWFLLALLASTLLKLALAWMLPLFGDEAFYWQESRALALGYTDVPPLVPWLIRLGTTLFGHSEPGVRIPFLAMGALLPCLVVLWARSFVPARDAWWAGTLALCLPLAGLLGLLALPDVPMSLAVLAGVMALHRALQHDRVGDWLLLGAALALGWLSHYRFVMFYLAGAAVLLALPQGLRLLRNPRFWLAQATGLLGLAPTLIFNAQSDWAALRFQFVERHPWRFHADALLEPVVQAVVTTPLLFAALLLAMTFALARRRDTTRPYALLGAASAGLLGGFLVLGLVADAERVRFHWPLPAYLIAMPLVPAILRSWWQRTSRWRLPARAGAVLAPGLAALLTLALAALLAQGARTGTADPGPLGRWLTDNASGWREVGSWARGHVARLAPDVVVADNFMLAAELDFALGGTRPVYVLDHPLNRKHGRAAQLAIWGRDEASLRRGSWRRGVLFFEEAARRPIDRLDSYQKLCGSFGRVRIADELALKSGRAPFLAFELAPGLAAGEECDVPAFAYIDEPPAKARIHGTQLLVRGWALKERVGVARVELLLDGTSRAQAEYGLVNERVRQQWPQSRDPGHPRVGFSGLLPLAGVGRGAHVLALRVVDRDGESRILARQTVMID